jgi:hypothetical protein
MLTISLDINILPANVFQSHRVQIVEPGDSSLHQKVLRANELGSDIVAHDLNSISGMIIS